MREANVQEKFVASAYQSRIFDEVRNGKGNILVEACAGSGKTTTILKSLVFIPSDKSVLMVAFNKAIVSTIKKRVSGERENVEVKTLHGLGFDMLRNHYGNDILLDNYKYNKRLTQFFTQYYGMSKEELGYKRYRRIYGNIIQLCNIARCYMSDGGSGLNKLSEKYDICATEEEMKAARELMQWGMRELDVIDFTDMIWLPNVLNIENECNQYDYVFIDECQDLNTSQRNLVLKCLAQEGRFIAVGDKDQAIYAFSGADTESFNILRKTPNTVSLPLSISYRCAREIVDYAKSYSCNIEVNPQNQTKGIVEFDMDESSIDDNAMVLCRNNAPLAELYFKLLCQGKKCFIKGKDVGENIIKLLDTTDEEALHVDLKYRGVFYDLYKELIEMKDRMIRNTGLSEEEIVVSPVVQNRYDMIKTLATLAHGCQNKKQLAQKVKEVFQEEGDGITLSTIHKAKGLESECVYILKRSLLPSPYASKEWEIRQEKNLEYVAYTRAKRKLSFLKDDEEKDGAHTANDMVEKFKRIEEKLHGSVRAPKGSKEKASSDGFKRRNNAELRFKSRGNWRK